MDIFPPAVDDPYEYGQIAAANSLSDVWAMGGEAKLAMNIFMFPESMEYEDVHNIMLGGYDKVREAGAIVVGGHTIKDPIPKYGLCVSGFVNPKRILRNNGIKPGDALVLTKPLGTGVLTNADRGGLLSEAEHKKLVSCMAQLNKYAADAVRGFDGIHACTDVTGFSLLGHSFEMCGDADCTIYIDSASVPLLPSAPEYASMGLVPANTYKNRKHLAGKVAFSASVPENLQDLLFDPQTSGGLLYAVSGEQLEPVLDALRRFVPNAAVIGYADIRAETPISVF